MRLLCTIDGKKENPLAFSHFLSSEGIKNQCEETGGGQFYIWVIDEDEVDRAQNFYLEFQKEPGNAKYTIPPKSIDPELEAQTTEEATEKTPPPRRRRGFLSSAPYGPISICILVATILLFVWAQVQRGVMMPPKVNGVVQAPILAPIEQKMIFDYPQYFELRDDLSKIYTSKDIEDQIPPTPQAKSIISKLQKSTTWMGAYDRIVLYIKYKDTKLTYDGPLFEDIRQGQVWRLFTPALLHFDFLHIFFNILWFIILGNQIEFRIGGLRYLAMILILAAVTNTAQYLVSGPFFMGLSGVVCGMAAFIWARQQVAPWEGYLLNRLTLLFLGIFIVGMFVLQLVFFFLQIFGSFEVTIGIANTAHIMGGVMGYLLGRMRRVFQVKSALN